MPSIREVRPGVHHVRIRRGKLPPEYLTLTGTRADVEAHLQRAARTAGLRPLPRTAPLGTWLRHCIGQQTGLAAQTLVNYGKYVDLWIDPPGVTGFCLGRIPVCALTASDLDAWTVHSIESRERAGKAGLGGNARRKVVTLVRWAAQQAVTAGMIQSNPFRRTKLPKMDRIPPILPSDQELQRFEDPAYEIDPRARLLLILARDTGARRGELLGLRWGDVDLEPKEARHAKDKKEHGPQITIGAALEHMRGQKPALKTPKSTAGRRTIALPQSAVVALRHAKSAANLQHRTLRLAEYPVFSGDDGGMTWWHPEAASQIALRVLTQLGIRTASRAIGLHTLRHAHATALLREGVSPHIVSRRLGHADIRVTLDLYAHAVPADDAAAAAVYDRLLARPATEESA